MSSIFEQVAFNRLAQSKFDLSHDIKLSFKMGQIVPTCVMEAMPGDTFTFQVQNLMRFAPLIAPVMHKVEISTMYFFVPNRILWDGWEDFITDKADLVHPYVNLGSGTTGTVTEGSLADYMGIPTGEYEEPVKCNPMPFAAYMKIRDEYFRDQDLDTEVYMPLTDGDNEGNYGYLFSSPPFRAAWKKDYLTSARPYAQKGDAVKIPLTFEDNVPVVMDPQNTSWLVAQPDGDPMSGPATLTSAANSHLQAGGFDAILDPNGNLSVDIQSAATDIETLREAWTMQGWLERQVRAGSRYFEQLMAMWDVKSPDARLQRSDFIGSSKQMMVISEVMSTAQSSNDPNDATVAVGTMAGHGISVGGGNSFKYRTVEHGWFVGVVIVRPLTAYQDGLHRKFQRFDRFEYPWPQFANLGMQPILQSEVRARVEAGTDPYRTFGYTLRYNEMKYENNRVAGEMRSTLDYWHLGRVFTSPTDPELTTNFIRCNPDTRIFAVTDPEADHIYAHIFNNISAVRKLPRFGIPWAPQ